VRSEAQPLLDAFLELRARNFQLGVAEYGLALEALAGGFGTRSRADLIATCLALWAKSPEEQTEVAMALESVMPPQWEWPAAVPDETPAAAPEGEGPREAGSTPHTGEAMPWQGGAAASASVIRRGRTPGAMERDAGAAPRRVYALNPHHDFVGSLPIDRREMRRAWRYYRRMQRVGPPVEIDVAMTVRRLQRTGVLDRPVLVPRRVNRARLLILCDAGGSMVPFRYVIDALLESARSAGLERVDVRFFHNVPADHVYADLLCTRPEPLAPAVAPFADAGVLIISDAGAARGLALPGRVRATEAFLKAVRRHTLKVAWLNPVPTSRWEGTSAGEIQRASGIEMFALHRAGLDAAVDVLRGRGS